MSEKYDRNSTGSLRASERARWPPLTRMLMSGEMSGERPKELSMREKFDRWMVNEGYRRLWVRSSGSITSGILTIWLFRLRLRCHSWNGLRIRIYELPAQGQPRDSSKYI